MTELAHLEHYTQHPVFSGEPVDVAQYCDFITGNVIKYLWRCPFKKSLMTDLAKAADYCRNLPAPNISIVPQQVVDRMQAEADAALDGRDSDLLWCTTTAILHILNRRYADALDLINIAIGKAGQ